jgi:hypothetical protein
MSQSLSVASSRRLRRYPRQGRKQIAGWFVRADAEIFSSVLTDQRRRGLPGSPLEIGVHHGRSFIPLCLSATSEEPAIAVDIFENQEHNLHAPSGRGDYRIFCRNIKRFGDLRAVQIICGSSLDLTPEKIGRELRFVSIDGAHWHGAVLNDLRLAARCACPDCVIAVDDFFNPDFIDVTSAYFEWATQDSGFAPFAISKGKLYLCRPEHVDHYQEVLLQNPYILFNNKKTVDFMDQKVLVITGLYGGFMSPLKRYLQVKAPSVHATLRAWVKRQGKRLAGSRRLRGPVTPSG